MRLLEKLLPVLRWLAGFTVMALAAVFGALAFAAENAPLLLGCMALGLALLFPLSHTLAEGIEDFWRWNQESSLLPAIARDVMRVLNQRLLMLSSWKDSDNAQRGAFDPVIEAMIERHELAEARKLAAEKLWGAHCAGSTRDERMYRRYMHVVDQMRKEMAA